MYQAKDGKKFGSKFAGRKYDSVHGGEETKEKQEPEEKTSFEGAEEKSGVEGKELHEDDQKGEMHPVVAEHGKAHKVHIHHDHLRNKHHVTTLHEDGHVNESDHNTAHEAHQEGQQLAGAAQPEEGQEEKNPMSGGSEDLGGEGLMGNM